MPDCRHCQAAVEDDTALAKHLAHEHDWEALSRIDRKRVEVLLPTAIPPDEAEPSLSLDETTDLDALVDRDPTGDVVTRAIAEYNRLLRQAEQEDERGHANDVFWEYYEPLADRLDAVVRQEGETILTDLIDTYESRNESDMPPASPVIENAVGRHLIRTRVTEGVEAMAAERLDYLYAVLEGKAEVTWEEAAVFGWGIGHPSLSVAECIQRAARDDVYWATAALEHAFYADQHAACDCLVNVATDEQVDDVQFLLTCVVGPDSHRYWPTAPRYWDWQTGLPVTVEWDAAVVDRLRDLVTDIGLDAELPADWSLQDLAV